MCSSIYGNCSIVLGLWFFLALCSTSPGMSELVSGAANIRLTVVWDGYFEIYEILELANVAECGVRGVIGMTARTVRFAPHHICISVDQITNLMTILAFFCNWQHLLIHYHFFLEWMRALRFVCSPGKPRWFAIRCFYLVNIERGYLSCKMVALEYGFNPILYSRYQICEAWLAQLVEYQTFNLRVQGLRPCFGKGFNTTEKCSC